MYARRTINASYLTARSFKCWAEQLLCATKEDIKMKWNLFHRWIDRNGVQAVNEVAAATAIWSPCQAFDLFVIKKTLSNSRPTDHVWVPILIVWLCK